MVVKRYHNRRLYDTDESRYVTLDEIAERIRAGADIRFVDAPSGADITQHFLAQIILDGRGASRLLPEQLLYQLIRMDDDALSVFFGRYVTWALDVYLRVRSGAQTVAQYNPLAQVPLAATDAMARLWAGLTGWGAAPSQGFGPPRYPQPPGAGHAPPPDVNGGFGGPFPGPPSPHPTGGGPADAVAPADMANAAGAASAPRPDEAGATGGSEAAASAGELAELRAELAAIRAALQAGSLAPAMNAGGGEGEG